MFFAMGGTRFGGLNFVAPMVHCTFDSCTIAATFVFGMTINAKMESIKNVTFSGWSTLLHSTQQISVDSNCDICAIQHPFSNQFLIVHYQNYSSRGKYLRISFSLLVILAVILSLTLRKSKTQEEREPIVENGGRNTHTSTKRR